MTYPTQGAHRPPEQPAWQPPPARAYQLVQTSPHWSFVFRNVAVGTAALLLVLVLTYGVVVAVRVNNAAREVGNSFNLDDGS